MLKAPFWNTDLFAVRCIFGAAPVRRGRRIAHDTEAGRIDHRRFMPRKPIASAARCRCWPDRCSSLLGMDEEGQTYLDGEEYEQAESTNSVRGPTSRRPWRYNPSASALRVHLSRESRAAIMWNWAADFPGGWIVATMRRPRFRGLSWRCVMRIKNEHLEYECFRG